jgi:hypothetical protein
MHSSEDQLWLKSLAKTFRIYFIIIIILAVLEFELRASHLLGRCSTLDPSTSSAFPDQLSIANSLRHSSEEPES